MPKQKYIQMAIDEAYNSEHKCFRHGAILVNGKNVISIGHNQPIRNHFDFKSVHAEMHTILEAKRKRICVKNADIYVVRISNTGACLLSKPCDLCMNILKNNQIRNVIYSTTNDEFKTMRVL